MRWCALAAYTGQAVSGYGVLPSSIVLFTGVVLSSRQSAAGFIEECKDGSPIINVTAGRSSRCMSVIGATADDICSQRVFRLLTPSRPHGLGTRAKNPDLFQCDLLHIH
jgi:hypothetical protein